MEAVRLHKVGFPKHMPLGEFRRRFGLLSSDTNNRPGSPVSDERRAVEDMLLSVDIDPASYRVGQSQVSLSATQQTSKPIIKSERKSSRFFIESLSLGWFIIARRPIIK